MPSKDDAEAFVGLAGNTPNVATHPNAAAWYNLVSLFTPDIRGSWSDAQPEAAAGNKKGGKPAKEEGKAKAKAAKPA